MESSLMSLGGPFPVQKTSLWVNSLDYFFRLNSDYTIYCDPPPTFLSLHAIVDLRCYHIWIRDYPCSLESHYVKQTQAYKLTKARYESD